MSDEPGVPGADEPDAPGTEDEPTPPGMEEAEDNNATLPATASTAPQEGATTDDAVAGAIAGSADAPAVEGAAAYQYYDQQQATAAYPAYGEQYAGYDQYYGYWPGYSDTSGECPRSSPSRLLLLAIDTDMHSEALVPGTSIGSG